MPKPKKLIVGPVLLVVLALGFYGIYRGRTLQDRSVVRVSGNVEITDAELSFEIAGRVVARPASEGHTIQAGDAVARLDDRSLRQELALKQAELQAAQAALAELEAGSRPEEIAQAAAAVQKAQAALEEQLAGSRPQEIGAAEAAVAQAKADLDRLKRDFERKSRLLQEDAISTRDFEAARSAYDAVRARIQEATERLRLVQEGPRKESRDQARAALQEARERYDLVKKGPRVETIEQARARAKEAQEALELARIRLGYATLSSPLSGVVLSENIEPGEYVVPGTPIVTVGDLENVWVRAYISETDLGRVKLGQAVRVTTDTFPGKTYEGRVAFIASQAEFTPKNVQTEKERVKLVYRIKIDIRNPNLELKPGMPADADILVGSR